MSDFLFIYGTLLPDRAPAEIAGSVRLLRPIGPAQVKGHLYNLGEYPVAVLDASPDEIIPGQVFELPEDQAVLASLDLYEEYDPCNPQRSLFLRVKSTVTLTDDGHTVESWLYIYNQDAGWRRIPDRREEKRIRRVNERI
jgi:gamma-glutamylcyclotransferase (GGCT)/AIG2-like uncharacterized protein YtfP